MMNKERIERATTNFNAYIRDGLLRKGSDQQALRMHIRNSELSITTAEKLLNLEDKEYKPYLWVIVCSYYSVFYIANAVLLTIGYKVGRKIRHAVTADALIVIVKDKLRKELLEDYEESMNETDEIIESFDLERGKRSFLQYEMTEEVKRQKAITSLNRAKRFRFELSKLLK